jgi:hypothetical protein
MRKTLLTVLLLLVFVSGCSTAKTEKATWEAFPKLTFSELNTKLDAKGTFVAYFGWTKNCGDATNIQTNYFNAYLTEHPEWLDDASSSAIYAVDLDAEIPVALRLKTFRQPMTDMFSVAYSPTLIAYKDGVIIGKIEWTPLTSDPSTGIAKDVIDTFFANAVLGSFPAVTE